jgi:prolyl oligopeptidase PreP (S9A serine peptidase family)
MTDPHLWLEEVDGADALAWVRARNDESAAARLSGPPESVQLVFPVEELHYAEQHNADLHNVQ